MALELIEFPKTLPEGFEWLDDEPIFDPDVHLQFEPSQYKWRLDEIGHTQAEIAECPSNIATAGPFRVLSDEGADEAVRGELDRAIEDIRDERIGDFKRLDDV